MPSKIALFASGSGSNVENIVQYFRTKKNVNFPIIISNKADAKVHDRAQMLGIPSITFSREDFQQTTPILRLLHEHNVDYIVLAGFLLKIPEALVEAYPNRIINIHPALLPKFGGKGMYGMHVHKAVVESGEKETGITIHYVNAHYDEGNIIYQVSCPVTPQDSPETVAEKVHQLEYEHFPRVIEELWG